MAYGILVDVHGPEDWFLSTEQIIGNNRKCRRILYQ